MPSSPLSELLRLPVGERAEIAMAPWESLGDAERDVELVLTPEQATAESAKLAIADLTAETET